jgi:two-component system, LytTR family, sensor kinase
MIEDYINLEQVRLKMPKQISLNIQGNMTTHSIAPMLLIPFVENAIKHGMDTMVEHGFIKILIVIEQGVLTFKCANNYKEKTNKAAIGGIGLENVRKRLSLIYPKNSSLDIKHEECLFDVSLTINLNP